MGGYPWAAARDGGFIVLELPSRVEAIAWAARIAKACRCDPQFTLPAPISAIAYYNKAVIYRLLFEVAAETLPTIAADSKHLGAQIAATLVLHTWIGTNAPPACARHCARRWFVQGWPVLGGVQTGFLLVSARALAPVL